MVSKKTTAIKIDHFEFTTYSFNNKLLFFKIQSARDGLIYQTLFSLSKTSYFLSKQNNVVKHDSKNDNYVGRVRFKLIPGMFGFDRYKNCPVNRIKKNLDGWREFCAVELTILPPGD